MIDPIVSEIKTDYLKGSTPGAWGVTDLPGIATLAYPLASAFSTYVTEGIYTESQNRTVTVIKVKEEATTEENKSSVSDDSNKTNFVQDCCETLGIKAAFDFLATTHTVTTVPSFSGCCTLLRGGQKKELDIKQRIEIQLPAQGESATKNFDRLAKENNTANFFMPDLFGGQTSKERTSDPLTLARNLYATVRYMEENLGVNLEDVTIKAEGNQAYALQAFKWLQEGRSNNDGISGFRFEGKNMITSPGDLWIAQDPESVATKLQAFALSVFASLLGLPMDATAIASGMNSVTLSESVKDDGELTDEVKALENANLAAYINQEKAKHIADVELYNQNLVEGEDPIEIPHRYDGIDTKRVGPQNEVKIRSSWVSSVGVAISSTFSAIGNILLCFCTFGKHGKLFFWRD